MAEVVGIRFKEVGKVYYFDPDGMQFKKGDRAVVETARGVECGEIAMENREVDDSEIVKPLKRIVRPANENDLRVVRENRAKEQKAFSICEEKIRAHNLDMKLVDVEYTFDGGKILFYFTADGRVDFRELVKDLAGVFRTRIELRQIGVRDESKMVGGFGMCGRPFCCSTFLGDFQPVSIKMAKEQNLSLSPTKISGLCGRLMCCLNYEQAYYEELRTILPRVGAEVRTPDGKGTVMDTNAVRQLVKVKVELGEDETDVREYAVGDIKILRKNNRKPKTAEEQKEDAPVPEADGGKPKEQSTEKPGSKNEGKPKDKGEGKQKPKQQPRQKESEE